MEGKGLERECAGSWVRLIGLVSCESGSFSSIGGGGGEKSVSVGGEGLVRGWKEGREQERASGWEQKRRLNVKEDFFF